MTLKLYTKPSFIKRLIGEKVKYIDTIQFNISELQEIRRKQEGEKCKKDPYDIPGLVVEKPKPKKRRKRTPAQRLQAMRRKEEKEKYKSQK